MAEGRQNPWPSLLRRGQSYTRHHGLGCASWRDGFASTALLHDGSWSWAGCLRIPSFHEVGSQQLVCLQPGAWMWPCCHQARQRERCVQTCQGASKDTAWQVLAALQLLWCPLAGRSLALGRCWFVQVPSTLRLQRPWLWGLAVLWLSLGNSAKQICADHVVISLELCRSSADVDVDLCWCRCRIQWFHVDSL